MTPRFGQFGGALYSDLLLQGVTHFFPAAQLEPLGPVETIETGRFFDSRVDGGDRALLTLQWMGHAYALRRPMHPFTECELSLTRAIGRALSARYRALFNPDIAASNFHLFRGLPEDKYVSAFLDPRQYGGLEKHVTDPDRVSDAIEVLRTSALTTYENLRISTGALLVDAHRDDPPGQDSRAEKLRYTSALTSVRSFSRFVDGMQTVALVDGRGVWVDIVDLEEWASETHARSLPLCGPSAYAAHRRATLAPGAICLTLTPRGEIKVFKDGVQAFAFLNGRWRLTDMAWKHERWIQAAKSPELAERILQVALDMAEARRGGLFVMLDDVQSAHKLVAPEDRIDLDGHPEARGSNESKRRLFYLLRNKRVETLSPAMLRTLAAIDGAVVLDGAGGVLAFGAILRHHQEGVTPAARRPEGGRSLAALAASHFGRALKISEDGILSLYEHGRFVWDL